MNPGHGQNNDHMQGNHNSRNTFNAQSLNPQQHQIINLEHPSMQYPQQWHTNNVQYPISHSSDHQNQANYWGHHDHHLQNLSRSLPTHLSEDHSHVPHYRYSEVNTYNTQPMFADIWDYNDQSHPNARHHFSHQPAETISVNPTLVQLNHSQQRLQAEPIAVITAEDSTELRSDRLIQGRNGPQLYKFLLRLLVQQSLSSSIEWIQENIVENGIPTFSFRFKDKDGVPKAWGVIKNNTVMDNDKLLRSIRDGYNKHFIKLPNEPFGYAFVVNEKFLSLYETMKARVQSKE